MLFRLGEHFTRIHLRARLPHILYQSLKVKWSPSFSRRLPSKYNILLMGSPGCGKTSTGQVLAERLSRPVVDIDNDYLEPYWGMSVGDKLSKVGGENFIQEEGNALLEFQAEAGSIVSLTGSNPLHLKAMDHVTQSGVVVFVDVHSEDILHRLHKMKVDRLVTHKPGQSIADVLKYRQQFYEKAYDIRILCERYESVESVAAKVMEAIENFEKPATFVSTRNVETEPGKNGFEFRDVVLQGLADDGGLFVPQGPFPKLTDAEWDRLVERSFQERALCILEKWLHPNAIHPKTLRQFIDRAYSESSFESKEVIPVVKLHKNQFVVEIFHGPTASFKDAALQLMPHFFAHAASRGKDLWNGRYLILVATSGDTGSAVLNGFSKVADENADIQVMVLYPDSGISSVQKALMTSVDSPNVKVIGVDGDFDDCQSAIKTIFSSRSLANHLMLNHNVKLSAANSINWGRLLPQVVYHASAYLELVRQKVIRMGDECDICIPTGNFGNIVAAFYAKEMGIPFKRVICASNVNNVLNDFFQTGVYDLRGRGLQVTSSPAIDILKSSNLERFLHLVTDGNGSLVKEWFENLNKNGMFQVPVEIQRRISEDFNLSADWCNEEKCADTIKEVFQETGYLMDPHTAVGKAVADRFESPDRPMLICATAHYGKFPEDVLRSLDILPNEDNPAALFDNLRVLSPIPRMHPELESAIFKKRVHNTVVKADVQDILKEIITFCSC